MDNSNQDMVLHNNMDNNLNTVLHNNTDNNQDTVLLNNMDKILNNTNNLSMVPNQVMEVVMIRMPINNNHNQDTVSNSEHLEKLKSKSLP